MISTRKQRAAVLLFVLATLALMAALAVAFARHSMTERRASRGYADKVRAQMLAEAGIQHALGHLSAVADKQWDSLLDSWVCLDPPDATLEALRHPSLRRGIAHELAYSGLLGSDIEPPQPNHLHPRRGTYAVNGDQYTLRVVDLSSRIDLRHPDTDGEGNLRLLNNLCQLIGLDVLAGDSLAARPGSNGFSSLDEILALFDEQTAEKLAPYLTVHAWRDRTAVRPGVRRKAGDASLTSEPHGRAPLNLNLAPAVLVQAVLTDIAATFLETSTRRTRSVRIRPNVAKTLTDLVVARRRKRPFQSHADFESFIAGLVGRPLTLNQAALIAVHANPDARLLKFNPDRALFGSTKLPRPFDRSDLTRFTTEFTFRRTGAFRVESLGRVIAPTGIVVARAEISTVVRVHSQQRVTSQHAHLTTAQEREGVTLYPESYGAAKRTSSLTGRIGLDSPPVSGLAFFQKGSLKPVVGSLPQPEGSAATGSVFIGGNRFADGYHAQREQKRTLS